MGIKESSPHGNPSTVKLWHGTDVGGLINILKSGRICASNGVQHGETYGVNWFSLGESYSFYKGVNLDNLDPQCAPLGYITGQGMEINCDYVMSNNFAFGGINTSLIFKKWKE